MKKLLALTALSVGLVAAGTATRYTLRIEPAKYQGVNEDNLFQQYCGQVPRISTQIPKPNYNDPLVKAATANLNTVAPVSFYMYNGVVKSYGFSNKGYNEDGSINYYKDEKFPIEFYRDAINSHANKQFGNVKNWDTGELTFSQEKLDHNFNYEYRSKANPAPEGIKGNTHAFMTYLCGEFRDRPTLIKEKLEWIQNMIKLPVAKQVPIFPSKDLKNVWSKLTAESYAYYVTFSRAAYNAKEREAYKDGRTMPLSVKWDVDIPVPAFTVCEVKYILTEYVTRMEEEKKRFPGYEAYMKGYHGEDGKSGYQASFCSTEDKDYYYDFRGDSNMKPNSPESNAMIWYSTGMMNRCRRNAKGEVYVTKGLEFDSKYCEKYMKEPFAHRWNAARSALATWIMHKEEVGSNFGNTGYLVSIIPPLNPELSPASFEMEYGEKVYQGSDMNSYLPLFGSNFQKNWQSGDLGYNSVFGVKGPGEVERIDLAYERIKGAVDRHTDWYASGYNDSYWEPKRARKIEQAFSPFVASSYEMSESDAFTAPGITVQGPRDGRRQWMYVFRVHKDKWYNTEHLAEGKQVNFDTQWFDETSFGTTHLADTERAWDRLGTPLEGEMESIIYLHNVTNTGMPIKNMSFGKYPPNVDDQLGATKN